MVNSICNGNHKNLHCYIHTWWTCQRHLHIRRTLWAPEHLSYVSEAALQTRRFGGSTPASGPGWLSPRLSIEHVKWRHCRSRGSAGPPCAALVPLNGWWLQRWSPEPPPASMQLEYTTIFKRNRITRHDMRGRKSFTYSITRKTIFTILKLVILSEFWCA